MQRAYEELPKILWAHRVTKRQSIGQTPFKLMFGFETVLPTKVSLPTICSDVLTLSNENMRLSCKGI